MKKSIKIGELVSFHRPIEISPYGAATRLELGMVVNYDTREKFINVMGSDGSVHTISVSWCESLKKIDPSFKNTV